MKCIVSLAIVIALVAVPAARAADTVVEPARLVIDTDHYPHFGVHGTGEQPRGFVFAKDANKNAAFFAVAAAAKAGGKKLKIQYGTSNPNAPSISEVSKVEIVE